MRLHTNATPSQLLCSGRIANISCSLRSGKRNNAAAADRVKFLLWLPSNEDVNVARGLPRSQDGFARHRGRFGERPIVRWFEVAGSSKSKVFTATETRWCWPS